VSALAHGGGCDDDQLRFRLEGGWDKRCRNYGMHAPDDRVPLHAGGAEFRGGYKLREKQIGTRVATRPPLRS
jgi:hypothetical protein